MSRSAKKPVTDPCVLFADQATKVGVSPIAPDFFVTPACATGTRATAIGLTGPAYGSVYALNTVYIACAACDTPLTVDDAKRNVGHAWCWDTACKPWLILCDACRQ